MCIYTIQLFMYVLYVCVFDACLNASSYVSMYSLYGFKSSTYGTYKLNQCVCMHVYSRV